MIATAAMIGIQAASSLASFFGSKRRKPKPFGQTAYGKELSRQSREGAYGTDGVKRIVGQTSRATGNVAQGERSRVRGRLVNQLGSSKSIAGERALAAPGQAHLRAVADTADKVETANEMSKRYATDRFAQMSTAREDERRVTDDYNKQRVVGLGVGLARAGVSGYQAHQRGKQMDAYANYQNARADQLRAGDSQFEFPQGFEEFDSEQLAEYYVNKVKPRGLPWEWFENQWYERRAGGEK